MLVIYSPKTTSDAEADDSLIPSIGRDFSLASISTDAKATPPAIQKVQYIMLLLYE
jgi:hypothetical protein